MMDSMLVSGGEAVRIDPMNSEVAETNSSLRKVTHWRIRSKGRLYASALAMRMGAYPLGKYS